MRIAAILAGAALSALVMFSVSAHAASGPLKPRVLVEQTFGDAETATIAGEPEATRADSDGAQVTVKKRRKPQLQTRFFSE